MKEQRLVRGAYMCGIYASLCQYEGGKKEMPGDKCK
jgi:hypothetical protein